MSCGFRNLNLFAIPEFSDGRGSGALNSACGSLALQSLLFQRNGFLAVRPWLPCGHLEMPRRVRSSSSCPKERHVAKGSEKVQGRRGPQQSFTRAPAALYPSCDFVSGLLGSAWSESEQGPMRLSADGTNPEGPSTQYSRTLILKPLMVWFLGQRHQILGTWTFWGMPSSRASSSYSAAKAGLLAKADCLKPRLCYSATAWLCRVLLRA